MSYNNTNIQLLNTAVTCTLNSFINPSNRAQDACSGSSDIATCVLGKWGQATTAVPVFSATLLKECWRPGNLTGLAESITFALDGAVAEVNTTGLDLGFHPVPPPNPALCTAQLPAFSALVSALFVAAAPLSGSSVCATANAWDQFADACSNSPETLVSVADYLQCPAVSTATTSAASTSEATSATATSTASATTTNTKSNIYSGAMANSLTAAALVSSTVAFFLSI
ncbi:hypothetical protein HK100_008605 [Physocladia obscura]|uniref:Uncharacterized protein n=1 Tax=Physocladia obscura TaxID=109957 RepID=A0AAD5XBG1_9FUNG|nr:hypothetical protein HK100_008605 [Physocladia obscura]